MTLETKNIMLFYKFLIFKYMEMVKLNIKIIFRYKF